MKRYLSLLLALVLVLSLVPAIGVSAADANLIDPDLITFEEYEVGTDLSSEFASNTIMATVSDAFAKSGTKSAFVADTSTTSAALLRYQTESAKVLRLEFDIRPTVGGGTFRILNGVRGTANTAFWLGYANKKNADGAYYTAIQYHDGTKWIDLYAFSSTLAGKWHNFIVEANVEGTADIYVDNVFIGSAPRCDAGDYGDNATTAIDAVVFECGAAATTSGSYYLDDLKLVPVVDSFRDDFENKELGFAPGGSFDDPNMATVVEKANKDTGSAKALFLEDTSATAAASVRAVVNKADGLNLSFNYLGWSGGLQLYITDGARSTANTAYWLQFSGKNVQYYDGAAWVTLKTRDVFFTSWTNIRVEADMEGAKIFVDGELMGTALRAGGSYGTAVTDTIDSVNFVIGAVAGTGNKCYVDDVKLAPLSGLDVDFEDVAVSGSAEALPGYVQSAATSVIVDPSDMTNNVLAMGDVAHTATPTFEYAYQMLSKYTLEMDVFVPTSSNTLTFQIHDGSEDDTTNTAYIISFNHAYGLRVLGGSYDDKDSQVWSDLNTDTRLNPNAWNKIRFEVNTMFDGEVVIYLNDELVGNTGIAYVKQDEVYGMQLSLGAATQSCYVDNIKMSPASYETTITPSFAADCEDMTVGEVAPAPFANPKMATVAAKANATTGSKNAIFLEDTATDAAASVRAVLSEATSDFDLNFNYLGWSGGLQLYISSGNRSTVNTAYWIQFSGKNVQYYDGAAWVTLKTRDVFFTTWTNIRVEGNLEGADIYVNDELMGTALRAGGSYGTAVTDTIDSVNFVIGAVAGTGNKCYVDDVNFTGASYQATVTPEATVVDFEDVNTSAPVTTEENNGAVVTSDPVIAGGKALYLYDATNAKVPYINYTFASYDNLTLEFDAYVPDAKSIVTFQLFNGSKAGADTALWMQFNYAYGLRAFSGGKWQASLNATAKLQPKTWNKIRVDVVAGETPYAVISLNGVEVASTRVACSVQDFINGLSIFTGSATSSCYIDNIKVSPAANEVPATPGLSYNGNTISLTEDLTVDAFTVEAGMTLDLAGHTLTAGQFAAFGSVIDSSADNSGLLVAEDMLLSDMKQMPIAVDGGYKFFAYELKNLGARANADGSVKYGFAIDFANADAYALIAGVDVTMTLAWGENSQAVAFSAELVKQYGDLQVAYPTVDAAMILTVTGLDALEAGTELSVTPAVNAAGVTATGTAMVYTVE